MLNTLEDVLLPYQRDLCDPTASKKIVLKARQIGFSFCAAYMCVRKAASCPNTLSLILSIGQRAASELLDKVVTWAKAVRMMTDGGLDFTSTATEVTFSNGSRILSLPGGSADAARGFTVTGICVLDEFGFIPDVERLWAATLPTLTNRITGASPEILLGSTPTVRNSLFGRMWEGAPDFKHYRISITDAIAGGLPCDLDELHRLLPDPSQFAVEYLCAWNKEAGGLLDGVTLRYHTRAPETASGHYLGGDIGRTGDASAFVSASCTSDCVYVNDLTLLRNTPYAKQLDALRARHTADPITAGCLDATGIGSAVAEFAHTDITPNLTGVVFTAASKTRLYERLRSRLLQGTISFDARFKDILEADFANVRRLVTDTGDIRYTAGHTEQGHGDVVSALALLLQAVADRPPSASLPAATRSFASVFAPSSKPVNLSTGLPIDGAYSALGLPNAGPAGFSRLRA